MVVGEVFMVVGEAERAVWVPTRLPRGGRRDSLCFLARAILSGSLEQEGLVQSEPFSHSRLGAHLCWTLERAGRPGARAEEMGRRRQLSV